jgi:peptidoglycan/LPS O-acetylase OafA/YrhL
MLAALQQRWLYWACFAIALFALVVSIQVARLTVLLTLAPFAWLGLYGSSQMLFCAAASFALLAIFLRFRQRPARLWDSLAANAYGIYILHYPVVVWAQYAMLDVRLMFVLKAALAFVAALALSWGTAIMLRRIPGVARIV